MPTGTESFDLDAAGKVTVSPCAPYQLRLSGAHAIRQAVHRYCDAAPGCRARTTEGCDGIGPKDTFEADYGALLAKAYGTATRGWGNVPNGGCAGVDARTAGRSKGRVVDERPSAWFIEPSSDSPCTCVVIVRTAMPIGEQLVAARHDHLFVGRHSARWLQDFQQEHRPTCLVDEMSVMPRLSS